MSHALRQVITLKPRVIVRSKKGLLIGQELDHAVREVQFRRTGISQIKTRNVLVNGVTLEP